VIRCASE